MNAFNWLDVGGGSSETGHKMLKLIDLDWIILFIVALKHGMSKKADVVISLILHLDTVYFTEVYNVSELYLVVFTDA